MVRRLFGDSKTVLFRKSTYPESDDDANQAYGQKNQKTYRNYQPGTNFHVCNQYRVPLPPFPAIETDTKGNRTDRAATGDNRNRDLGNQLINALIVIGLTVVYGPDAVVVRGGKLGLIALPVIAVLPVWPILAP